MAKSKKGTSSKTTKESLLSKFSLNDIIPKKYKLIFVLVLFSIFINWKNIIDIYKTEIYFLNHSSKRLVVLVDIYGLKFICKPKMFVISTYISYARNPVARSGFLSTVFSEYLNHLSILGIKDQKFCT
ncbi:MAG: hypothetical protein MUO34_07860 [Ignavibacteriaceae bacterium]|nr:hypothetical protein [Ignavibacteriaceae bacterium]